MQLFCDFLLAFFNSFLRFFFALLQFYSSSVFSGKKASPAGFSLRMFFLSVCACLGSLGIFFHHSADFLCARFCLPLVWD